MKFISQITVALSVIMTISCNSGKQKVEPQCIQDKVDIFSETVECESGASVKEYKFQGDFVYVFNVGDCIADHSQEVVDYECNTIGHLGGLAGNSEVNGKDFDKKAAYIRTLFSN